MIVSVLSLSFYKMFGLSENENDNTNYGAHSALYQSYYNGAGVTL